MKITYLGHSGFIVETEHAIIVMDPWVSRWGAFDSAWFQYPKNHHMAHEIKTILATPNKEKFIYISHEHKDHFDLEFLMSLELRDFTLILADFHHNIVKDELEQIRYQCLDILVLKDNEPYTFQDGTIVLFVIDMELDADSAILIQSKEGTFLNLNDSKPHDRLRAIARQYGEVDVFSGQCSGAMWHPTCYKMDESDYQAACQHKVNNKFDTLAKSLEILNPSVFLPSAGPPCFLDPLLYPIQQQVINTYPRARQVLDFLDTHFKDKTIRTVWFETMPGDTFDVKQEQFSNWVTPRIDDHDFLSYVSAYSKEYEDYFQQRAMAHAAVNARIVFERLGVALAEKLSRMKLVHQQIETRLYVSLFEYPQEKYCVDFKNNIISKVLNICHSEHFFSMTAPAWQVDKVLSGQMSWADFSLTFRVTLERVPEVYNTLSHAFLTLDADRLEHFCQLFHDILSKKERVEMTWEGRRYSILRYCPHQGGDLADASIENGIVKCPRHGWRFDLTQGGRCIHNDTNIDAVCQD